MSIDSRQLTDLIEEVDQLHHESMRTFHEEVEEIHFGETAQQLKSSRRGFMQKAGAGGAVLTAASLANPVARFMPSAWSQGAALDDVAIAKFAASVEFAAVAAYQAAVKTGKLSPAIVNTGTMFAAHHQEHGDAFAALVKDTDKTANKSVLAAFSPMISSAQDEKALVEIALQLEEGAAATYLFALGALQDKSNAKATATILPVESQHAVVLAAYLNKPIAEYVPSFQTTKNALDPTRYPA